MESAKRNMKNAHDSVSEANKAMRKLDADLAKRQKLRERLEQLRATRQGQGEETIEEISLRGRIEQLGTRIEIWRKDIDL
ncbi:unnamed protein product [Linum trigynum]|uniref:Uncharacterized protein n=1 Tax=Linum trigynum TaxID=586398 RepID=A0AAV2G225_9ROSI